MDDQDSFPEQRKADSPVAQNFPCKQCGAQLIFQPGQTGQTCPYCAYEQPIPQNEADIEELDFKSFAEKALAGEETLSINSLKCSSCGAEASIDPKISARSCPFCASPQLVPGQRTLLRPRSLLPFAISKQQASANFRSWLHGLWFAPNKLKQVGNLQGGLNGLYVPFWTYDTYTTTFYRGSRGDAYYTTETYTAVENGRSHTKTRQVRKIRWHPVSGTVFLSFDDVMVVASSSLPNQCVENLEPWDLDNLVNFDPKYIAGFRAENYQLDLVQGFESAKPKMDQHIRQAIRRDMGGDEQRISSLRTGYDRVTFKHILLPIWISAYLYRNKVYRILVNGRTGEVQGERPFSLTKIIFAVGLALVVAGSAAYFFRGKT